MWGEREREGDAHKDKPRTENERFLLVSQQTRCGYHQKSIDSFSISHNQPTYAHVAE